jgi:hypothetical protein
MWYPGHICLLGSYFSGVEILASVIFTSIFKAASFKNRDYFEQ